MKPPDMAFERNQAHLSKQSGWTFIGYSQGLDIRVQARTQQREGLREAFPREALEEDVHQITAHQGLGHPRVAGQEPHHPRCRHCRGGRTRSSAGRQEV